MHDPELSPDKVMAAFQAAEEAAAQLQGRLASQATKVGYIRDATNYLTNVWPCISGSSQSSEFEPMLRSGIALMQTVSGEMRKLSDEAEQIEIKLQPLYLSTSIFTSNTALTAASVDPVKVDLSKVQVAPFAPYGEKNDLAARYGRHDTTLGEVCIQIWDCLYGTTADPERSALYMVRQVYDHFFGILAPDDDVRKSPFWQKKEGGKDYVTRDERIQFALETKVSNPTQRALLAETSKQMLETYQSLNRAHARKELDSYKARTALNSMYTYLTEWADAIGW